MQSRLARTVWGAGLVLAWSGLLVVVLLAAVTARAQGPQNGPSGNIHQGVATCASANCHGRLAPSGPVVRQNELSVWQDPSSAAGQHSRAFLVLTQDRAKAMAQKLNIEAPERARECLGCHADPVIPALRGPKHLVSDGVTCEGCHGGAELWLASHYAARATHAGNIAAGMTALDDPRVRAGVCLDCHFGSDKPGQFVTHRMMAAGHPRLSFELDLFTSLQAHHTVDADYRRRKAAPGGVQVWAVGQSLALDRAVQLYSNPALGQDGVFPQLVFFDCHACHRRISDERDARPTALANPARPLPVGNPVFNDENMIMLAAAARIADPALAGEFEARSRAFHTALTADRPSAIAAAGDLAATSRALSAAFARKAFTRDETFAVLDGVLTTVLARYTDYQGSAQGVMAADTLLSSLVAEGRVPAARAAAIRPDLERAYAAVRDPNTYDPLAFRATFQRVATAARALR